MHLSFCSVSMGRLYFGKEHSCACLPAIAASVCIWDISDAFRVERDSSRNVNIMVILYQIDSMLIVYHRLICLITDFSDSCFMANTSLWRIISVYTSWIYECLSSSRERERKWFFTDHNLHNLASEGYFIGTHSNLCCLHSDSCDQNFGPDWKVTEENVDCDSVGRNTLWSCKWLAAFQNKAPSPSHLHYPKAGDDALWNGSSPMTKCFILLKTRNMLSHLSHGVVVPYNYDLIPNKCVGF